MSREVDEIVELLDQRAFSECLIRCDDLTERFKTVFMEELTVNSATDYVGAVLLYARVCAEIKKPWMAFPKLENAKGALRFLKDFMSDSEILADSFISFAEAYAYGNYFPEAVFCFTEAVRYSDSVDKASEALSSAFFYEARFGKNLIDDFSFAEEKLGKVTVSNLKKAAQTESENRILTDPIESSETFLRVRYEVEAKTDDLLSRKEKGDVPFCVLYWNTKQAVLKEQYDIIWKTPVEMNPNIRFY